MAVLVDIEIVRHEPGRVVYRYKGQPDSWGHVIVSDQIDPSAQTCEVLGWTPAPGEDESGRFVRLACRKVFVIRRETGAWPTRATWAS